MEADLNGRQQLSMVSSGPESRQAWRRFVPVFLSLTSHLCFHQMMMISSLTVDAVVVVVAVMRTTEMLKYVRRRRTRGRSRSVRGWTGGLVDDCVERDLMMSECLSERERPQGACFESHTLQSPSNHKR